MIGPRDAFIIQREKYFKSIGLKKQGPAEKLAVLFLEEHADASAMDRTGVVLRAEEWKVGIYMIGGYMEQVCKLIKGAKLEVEESKKSLEKIVNEVRVLNDAVQPSLLDLIKRIRDMRMTVVIEISQMMTMLKDVRKFFIESDYKTEIERMERFVSLCKEMQKLKADGTLDGICDSALRLAIGKERMK